MGLMLAWSILLSPEKIHLSLKLLRNRLDSFGMDVIEVKDELKSLRVNEIGRNK